MSESEFILLEKSLMKTATVLMHMHIIYKAAFAGNSFNQILAPNISQWTGGIN